jgi:hypothetical protein
MKANCCLAVPLMAIAFGAAGASAAKIPIDISGLANVPWTYLPSPCLGGINNGVTFPSGAQNFGGVPFAIPAGPNNYWNGGVAANCGSGTVSLSVPVGVSGVTSAFTLLNSMWGQAGPNAYLLLPSRGAVARPSHTHWWAELMSAISTTMATRTPSTTPAPHRSGRMEGASGWTARNTFCPRNSPARC